MKLKLTNVNSLDKELFKLMLEEFPPCEMKSFEQINSLLKNDNYKLDILYLDNEIAGYILYALYDFIWVDYLAILKKFQSKGLGRLALEMLFEKYKDKRGCYFEVEKENANDINTLRRQNFYKKIGCHKLPFNYFFPNDIKELPMDLFYKKLIADAPIKDEIILDIENVFAVIHNDVKSKKTTLQKIKNSN